MNKIKILNQKNVDYLIGFMVDIEIEDRTVVIRIPFCTKESINTLLAKLTEK